MWFSFWICSAALVRPGRDQCEDAAQAHLLLVRLVYFLAWLYLQFLFLEVDKVHAGIRGGGVHANGLFPSACCLRLSITCYFHSGLRNSWPNAVGADVWRKVRVRVRGQGATIFSIHPKAAAEAQENRQS